MKKRFRVEGVWCEHLCCLHVLASSYEEALQAYEKAFTPEQRRGLEVSVTENPFRWERDGHAVYIGGYIY